MRIRLLLRFDDVCPTMNWSTWNQIERSLIEADVKPIVAVVPDNQDPSLVVGLPETDFWLRVRMWQRRGWTIGLHGYQHRFITDEAGILGRMRRSEFAGLPPEVQEIKMRNALHIFEKNNIEPDLWVAPAHSFDSNTLSTLAKLGFRVISDGYGLFPYRDSYGITWIPQQLGRFRKLPFGVWTICHHVNAWTNAEIAQFRRDLVNFRIYFSSVPEVLKHFAQRRRSWFDAGAETLIGAGHRIGRPILNNILRSRIESEERTYPVIRKIE